MSKHGVTRDEILEVIRSHGSPTVRFIAAQVGLRSLNTVAYHIDALVIQGVVQRDACGHVSCTNLARSARRPVKKFCVSKPRLSSNEKYQKYYAPKKGIEERIEKLGRVVDSGGSVKQLLKMERGQ